MIWKEKLTALLQALEVDNIDWFLEIATIKDYEILGKELTTQPVKFTITQGEKDENIH